MTESKSETSEFKDWKNPRINLSANVESLNKMIMNIDDSKYFTILKTFWAMYVTIVHSPL